MGETAYDRWCNLAARYLTEDYRWYFDYDHPESGISHLVTKRGKKGETPIEYTEVASPIPLCPTAIYNNVDTGIERVELSYYKHKRLRQIVVDRANIANKSLIIKLANDGIEVNSSNASLLVKYLADIIADNLDKLPCAPAKSVMGWAGKEFLPYTDAVAFDGDATFRQLRAAIYSKGTLPEWCDAMRPLRENLDLRLCMAASFASPLIELVGENSFVYHLWGGTGAGKTVALMVAMSIWGNPAMGAMVRTMNMTQNSMLSTAAFLRNLPFAGDELQTIKSSWTNYDQLIMRITEGIDRGRMTYDKVNETKSWKCAFLFTGEEPVIKSASGGGAKNRVIEVECKKPLVSDGNATANFVRSNYGTAGRAWIEHIAGDAVQEQISELYSVVFRDLVSASDATDKQCGAMALLWIADTMASALFWPDESAIETEQLIPFMSTKHDVDITERAFKFVCDTIAENNTAFTNEARQRWGKRSDGRLDGDVASVYFNRTVLERIMREAGFDLAACLSKWAERGHIKRGNTKGARVMARIDGIATSCIDIVLPCDDD